MQKKQPQFVRRQTVYRKASQEPLTIMSVRREQESDLGRRKKEEREWLYQVSDGRQVWECGEWELTAFPSASRAIPYPEAWKAPRFHYGQAVYQDSTPLIVVGMEWQEYFSLVFDEPVRTWHYKVRNEYDEIHGFDEEDLWDRPFVPANGEDVLMLFSEDEEALP